MGPTWAVLFGLLISKTEISQTRVAKEEKDAEDDK